MSTPTDQYSDSPDSPTMSTEPDQPLHSSPPTTSNNNIVKDVSLWRTKKMSASIMAAATATWVLLQIYQFNFLTIVSWASMAIVILLFLWGKLMGLLGKPPSMPDMEVSERAALDMANTTKGLFEEGLYWVFRWVTRSEWYEFAGLEAGLLVLSWIASRFDLITLLFIGTLLGLTAPAIYVKYEDKIKCGTEQVKLHGQKWYNTFDEKVLTRLKHKVGAVKGKKIE